MIVSDIKLATLGFIVMASGIIVLGLANFLVEGQKKLAWQWHRIKNLDEALYEFNLFCGAMLIFGGLLGMIMQKQIHTEFDEVITAFLIWLIFGGSFLFIIYFNIRFVFLGK